MLAQDGFSLIIAYRKSKAVAETMIADYQSRGVNCIAVQADLGEPDGAEKLLANVRGFRAPDTLVNNAGVSSFGLMQDVPNEELNRVMTVNFLSPFKLIRALAPGMISNRFGRIVNVTSMWALVGAGMESVYAASKAALTGLSKSLAKEFGSSNVAVNCVAPGLIDTEMNAALSPADVRALVNETPSGRMGKPIDVAKAIRLLVDEDCFINGETINVSGGLVIC